MNSFRLMVAVCAVALVGVSSALANEPGWTLTGPYNTVTGSPSWVVEGTGFTPNESIMVTKLGWYDHPSSSDGFDISIQLGLFDAGTQELLASATLPPGTGSEKIDFFRYVPVSPVTLEAGGSYIVAGLYDSVEPTRIVSPGNGMIESSVLSTTGWYHKSSYTLTYPTSLVPAETRTMGPNFMYEIPEPASLCLLGAGALVLCRRRR